jgi:hypothetical protein
VNAAVCAPLPGISVTDTSLAPGMDLGEGGDLVQHTVQSVSLSLIRPN